VNCTRCKRDVPELVHLFRHADGARLNHTDDPTRPRIVERDVCLDCAERTTTAQALASPTADMTPDEIAAHRLDLEELP